VSADRKVVTVDRETFLKLPDEEKWHAHAASVQATAAYRSSLERARAPGIFNGLPWVVRLAIVNFPVAVALFFMGQSAGVIPSEAQAQGKVLARLETTLSTHVGQTETLVARLTTALKVMCENSARDDVSRNNCRHIGPER